MQIQSKWQISLPTKTAIQLDKSYWNNALLILSNKPGDPYVCFSFLAWYVPHISQLSRSWHKVSKPKWSMKTCWVEITDLRIREARAPWILAQGMGQVWVTQKKPSKSENESHYFSECWTIFSFAQGKIPRGWAKVYRQITPKKFQKGLEETVKMPRTCCTSEIFNRNPKSIKP